MPIQNAAADAKICRSLNWRLEIKKGLWYSFSPAIVQPMESRELGCRTAAVSGKVDTILDSGSAEWSRQLALLAIPCSLGSMVAYLAAVVLRLWCEMKVSSFVVIPCEKMMFNPPVYTASFCYR